MRTRLPVRITSEPGAEFLPLANWAFNGSYIRIGLNMLESKVLVHEPVHALAHFGSASRMLARPESTLMFGGGLAEWTRLEVQRNEHDRARLRSLAARAWERFRFTPSELLLHKDFGNKYDLRFMYALGESWVTSMALECGKDTAEKILLALGESLVGLDATMFWTEVLAQANCSFSEVNTQFEELMTSIASALRPLPSAHVVPNMGGDWLRFTVRVEQDVRRYFNVRISIQMLDVGPTTQCIAGQGQDAHVLEFQKPREVNRYRYQVGIAGDLSQSEHEFFGEWIQSAGG